MKGLVDGKPMNNMLVDEGASVNLMSYTTFHKLGKGPGDLIETDMMLKDFGGNASKTPGATLCSPHSLSSMEKGRTVCSLVVIGFMRTVVYHRPCISV